MKRTPQVWRAVEEASERVQAAESEREAAEGRARASERAAEAAAAREAEAVAAARAAGARADEAAKATRVSAVEVRPPELLHNSCPPCGIMLFARSSPLYPFVSQMFRSG